MDAHSFERANLVSEHRCPGPQVGEAGEAGFPRGASAPACSGMFQTLCHLSPERRHCKDAAVSPCPTWG